VSGRVAQVNDERVEVVGETFGGGGVAGAVELVDERLESLFAVALAGGVIERLPVGQTHALALAFGQLGQQVADPVNGAALAVRGRPALLNRLDQTGSAVGHDQERRAEPAGDQITSERQPVLVRLAHPEHHREQHPFALLGKAPGDQHALLGARRPDRQEDRVQEQRRQLDVVEVAAPERLEALAQLLADARGGRL
jgi:hypothetical protein